MLEMLLEQWKIKVNTIIVVNMLVNRFLKWSNYVRIHEWYFI